MSATFSSCRPSHIPENRPKKLAAREGLRFERSFFKELRTKLLLKGGPSLEGHQLAANQWIAFEDENGRGNAEVDCILALPALRILLVFECKRTQTIHGLQQLDGLYLPLLRFMFPKDWTIAGLMVCKNLRQEEGPFVESIDLWLEHVIKTAALGKQMPTKLTLWRKDL